LRPFGVLTPTLSHPFFFFDDTQPTKPLGRVIMEPRTMIDIVDYLVVWLLW
jgi:hypothetical protein